jgi:DNA-binding NarL/FixJ family response regulator
MPEDLRNRLKNIGIFMSLSAEAIATESVEVITISTFSRSLLKYGIDLIMRSTGDEPDEVGTTMKDTGYWAVYRVKPASRLLYAVRPLSSPTRVMITSDRPILRARLRMQVESRADLLVVGEVPNYAEAITMAARQHPDFVLIDLGIDGCKALDRIPHRLIAARHILVVTEPYDDEMAARAKAFGATALVSVERAATAIMKHIDPEAAKVATLTERDRQVIILVARGLSDEQIAQHLSLTTVAVREHLRSVCSKLDVKDRFDLVIYAFLNGLTRDVAADPEDLPKV